MLAWMMMILKIVMMKVSHCSFINHDFFEKLINTLSLDLTKLGLLPSSPLISCFLNSPNRENRECSKDRRRSKKPIGPGFNGRLAIVDTLLR